MANFQISDDDWATLEALRTGQDSGGYLTMLHTLAVKYGFHVEWHSIDYANHVIVSDPV